MVIVANIIEAEATCHDYDTLITVGPKASEVQWGHPNHFVRTFVDVTSGKYAAKLADVASVLKYVRTRQGTLLVHCHKGESRSTAMALGILIQSGMSVTDANDTLIASHPQGRGFTPNLLMLAHIEQLLHAPGLVERYDMGRMRTSRQW
jgi:predicted protein tyrosine phosphatase